MEIELDYTKNVEQNAASYYEAAKKAKKKIEATKDAIARLRVQQLELEKVTEKESKYSAEKHEKARKGEWFEKLRWFVSSEGFLCIGGRDATTNDILVKKHMEKDDIVFHTEAPGSPFFIIKAQSKSTGQAGKPGQATINETAAATASFSKAWKLGLGFAEVYHIAPEQVSSTPPSGMYLKKGSFMIYGRKNIMNPALKLAIGVDEKERIMCGPEAAVMVHCKKYAAIVPGNLKASDAAKRIMKHLDIKLPVDDVIRALPTGGISIEAQKKG